ncbi:TonB-dependent receptor [Sphingomonas sp. DBB INV C78]
MQDVPIAITAFSGDALEDRKIQTAEDLSLFVPNLTLIPQASGNTTYAISMRGITQTDSVITADSPVAVYIDGVLAPKLAGGIFDFIDLERVEVLRGPQGTLYGRNTPAGAVNLVTRKPSGSFHVDAMVGLGNYDSRELRLGVDLPSADLGGLGTLAVRLGGRYFDRDGWVKDLGADRTADSRHRYGGRAALRWMPGPDWTIDYTFDRLHIRETPPANQLDTDFTGLLTQYQTDSRQKELTFGYNADPAAFADGTKTELDVWIHALTAEWRASENLTLRSITAQRKVHDNEPTDFDGTPLAMADFGKINKLKTFTQEIQGVASLLDDQLSIVAGFFYYEEDGFTHATGVFGAGTVKQDSTFSIDNKAYAVYGQVEWKPAFLDGRATIAAGLRYTTEKKILEDVTVLINDVFPIASLDRASETFDKLSPSAFLSYELTDDLTAYFRYAQGWRSGGFNGTSATSEQLRTPFDDETVDSYELGLKGSFWDRRATIALAGFISDYKDLQTVLTEPSVGGVGFQTTNSNIGKIRISGIELEASVRLIPILQLNGSYAYLHNDVKDFTLCVPVGQPGCEFTNVGNARVQPLTPKHSASFGAELTLLDNDSGRLTARTDVAWRGDSIGGGQALAKSPLSSDLSFIPDYTLVDARLAWGNIAVGGGTIELAAWAKNLFDADGPQFSLDLSNSLGITTKRYLTPRTYGLDLTYRF